MVPRVRQLNSIDRLRLVHANFLGEATEDGRPPYSEQTQRIVDEEVARLLRQAEQRAIALLRDHRAALERLAEQLVARETVDGSVVLDVLRQERSLADGKGDAVPASPPPDHPGARMSHSASLIVSDTVAVVLHLSSPLTRASWRAEVQAPVVTALPYAGGAESDRSALLQVRRRPRSPDAMARGGCRLRGGE